MMYIGSVMDVEVDNDHWLNFSITYIGPYSYWCGAIIY
jgi:hypothetical protein